MQGENKLLARLDGVTLVCRALQTVRAAALGPPVVVLGYQAQSVVEALARCEAARDATMVVNTAYASGQQGSVMIGLAALDRAAEVVMIMPADMPLLQPDDLQSLVAAFAARGPGHEVLVPFYGAARGNPVVVSRAAVAAALAAPGGGMRGYIDAHPEKVQRYEAGNDHYTVDVDTRQALEGIARRTGMRLDQAGGEDGQHRS